jgi:archaellum biogenesis ATPase FlaH
MEKQETMKLIRMNEAEATEVKWLWYPYIPFGKITVVQGDPGDGKQRLCLRLPPPLPREFCSPKARKSLSR